MHEARPATPVEILGLSDVPGAGDPMDAVKDTKKAASGTVLEALLDRGRGPVARVLVQDGALKVGDFILAGPGFGNAAKSDERASPA